MKGIQFSEWYRDAQEDTEPDRQCCTCEDCGAEVPCGASWCLDCTDARGGIEAE